MESLKFEQKHQEAAELIKNQRIKEALSAFEFLANAGHVISHRGMGIAYLYGQLGLEINYGKAMEWFQKAILQNDAISFYNLGCMLLNGQGITKNVAEAYSYIKQAADLGFADAQIAMGDYYYYGKYGTFDHEKANNYYEKAYKQGANQAAFMLGTMSLYDKKASGDLYENTIGLFNACGAYRAEETGVLKHLLKNAHQKPVVNEAMNLDELLEKLLGEHRKGYYYRGQTKDYGNPMCPSAYRLGHSVFPINFEDANCLRKTETEFYFENSFGSRNADGEDYRIRRLMSMYLNNAFGYTFTQALFQQAGYSSEGLDITSDLIIALFFSTYKYITKKASFELLTDKNISVIYRWRSLGNEDSGNALQKNGSKRKHEMVIILNKPIWTKAHDYSCVWGQNAL